MNAQSKIEAGVPAVYSAIAAVMAHMAKEGISKDRRSGDGGGPKFAFRGIDDVYNALAPVMAANQLMMLPRMIGREQQERQTRNGGVMFYTTIEAEFDIVSGVDGSIHTVRTFGEAMDSSDKSTNKAMSAAFKYAAMQAFCIPTEGDNDADASSHDVAPRANGRSSDQRASSDEGGMPDAEWAKLAQLLKATKTEAAVLTKYFKVKNLRQLNQEQYGIAIGRLTDTLAKMAKEESNAKGNEDGQQGWSTSDGELNDISDSDVPF